MQIVTRENIVQPLCALDLLTKLAELRPEVCGNDCDPHGKPIATRFWVYTDPDNFGSLVVFEPIFEATLSPLDMGFLQDALQVAIAREGLRYRVENDGAGYIHVKICAVDSVAGAVLATSKWAAIALLEAFVSYLSREGSADA